LTESSSSRDLTGPKPEPKKIDANSVNSFLQTDKPVERVAKTEPKRFVETPYKPDTDKQAEKSPRPEPKRFVDELPGGRRKTVADGERPDIGDDSVSPEPSGSDADPQPKRSADTDSIPSKRPPSKSDRSNRRGTWSAAKFKNAQFDEEDPSLESKDKPAKCAACGKTVYATERIATDFDVFHKACLKCTYCNNVLKLGNYASLEGKYYCKPHFKQLFASKGNYNEGFGQEKLTAQWEKEKQSEQSGDNSE